METSGRRSPVLAHRAFPCWPSFTRLFPSPPAMITISAMLPRSRSSGKWWEAYTSGSRLDGTQAPSWNRAEKKNGWNCANALEHSSLASSCNAAARRGSLQSCALRSLSGRQKAAGLRFEYLDGKEIQLVARELRVSVPCVSKWRRLEARRLPEMGSKDTGRPGRAIDDSGAQYELYILAVPLLRSRL
jgi:hypothetical protein